MILSGGWFPGGGGFKALQMYNFHRDFQGFFCVECELFGNFQLCGDFFYHFRTVFCVGGDKRNAPCIENCVTDRGNCKGGVDERAIGMFLLCSEGGVHYYGVGEDAEPGAANVCFGECDVHAEEFCIFPGNCKSGGVEVNGDDVCAEKCGGDGQHTGAAAKITDAGVCNVAVHRGMEDHPCCEGGRGHVLFCFGERGGKSPDLLQLHFKLAEFHGLLYFVDCVVVPAAESEYDFKFGGGKDRHGEPGLIV